MNKCIGAILGIVGLISAALGGYLHFDNKFARAEELNSVKKRLEYKILTDQYISVQDRIWKLEDRSSKKSMDETAREEYRSLLNQKTLLDTQIKQLEKGSNGK